MFKKSSKKGAIRKRKVSDESENTEDKEPEGHEMLKMAKVKP